MKYGMAFIALILAIVLIDALVSRVQEIYRERARQRNIRRFALSPFKATKRDWWAL